MRLAARRYVALKKMKTIILILFIYVTPLVLNAQENIRNIQSFPNYKKGVSEMTVDILHHNISINPLNILLFQQIGVTYEYRPGKLGFSLTPGYIYANKAEYSNWFIAGPIKYGSLGWYSGWFIVPQVNLYLTKQNDSDEGGVFYFAAKFVYKFMSVDTSSMPMWRNDGDGYGLYRKMFDNVNIYGGFLDVGYRYFIGHFFIDVNFGPGIMWLNHDMTIYAEATGPTASYMHYIDPPKKEKYHEGSISINFTLNLGAAF